MWLDIFLLVLFAIHLVAFATLLVRRRQPYYVAVTLTFLLLVATYGVKLSAPDLVVGNLALFRWLRYAAWGAAAVSIGWLLIRKAQLKGRG